MSATFLASSLFAAIAVAVAVFVVRRPRSDAGVATWDRCEWGGERGPFRTCTFRLTEIVRSAVDHSPVVVLQGRFAFIEVTLVASSE